MPFTWRESQDAFGACAAEHVDPHVYSSNRKRWVLWHSSSAIGNALNVFVTAPRRRSSRRGRPRS